jgi:hypothetical protein
MNIKNYTTEVPATRSIEYIERLLINFGASNIMKEVKDARVASISFLVTIDGTPFAFKLPANVKACYLWLKEKNPKRKEETNWAQAERIAWKHQHEWLHIQLSSIELSQIEKLQALIPYSYDPHTGKSFYDRMKENKFQNLLPNG